MNYQKKFNLERENLFLKNNLNNLTKQSLLLKEKFLEVKNNEEKMKAKLAENNNIYLCNICYENPKNIILNPCFHFNLCEKCLSKIRNCTICREPIECYHIVYS